MIFRVSENTWIEAIVRYLVEPRRAGQVKSRLIKKMLEQPSGGTDKGDVPERRRAVSADHLTFPYFLRIEIVCSSGRASAECLSRPTTVVALNSEFRIASSVVSITA